MNIREKYLVFETKFSLSSYVGTCICMCVFILMYLCECCCVFLAIWSVVGSAAAFSDIRPQEGK